ncbi:MAG: flippase-like domain-containing protein [Myxococcota bacterium]
MDQAETATDAEQAPPTRGGGHHLLHALPFALVVGALVFVAWHAGGPGPVLDALAALPPLLFLAAVGFLALDLAADGLRYTATGAALGSPIRPLLGVRTALVNLFAAFLTPGAGGAAPAVAWMLNRRGFDGSRGLAIGLIKGLLGFYVLVPLAVLFSFVSPSEAVSEGVVRGVLAGSGIALTLLLAGVTAIALWPRLSARTIGRVMEALHQQDRTAEETGEDLPRWKRLMVRLDDLLQETAHDFGAFLRGRALHVASAFLLTAINLASLATLAVIVGLGVHPEVGVAELVSLSVLFVVLVFISPTPGGAGIAEGGGMLIFAGIMPEPQAAALIIVWRTFTCYVPFILGALVFSREVRQAAEQAPIT